MTKSYFFVGIGGSGMLPLAQIVAARGHRVAGSDRSLDQGRLGAKFAELEAAGIELFAQDGSGLVSADQIVVASAAIEATVPDVRRATELGCARLSRAELLAELFNAAPVGIAVGGTSGKSTVTGMICTILTHLGHDPTIMNGAVMKDLGSGARVGGGGVFVSEVDESDGSIALYRPGVAVLNNVAVDHKSLDELRALFGAFLAAADAVVVNADNAEALALITPASPEPVEGRATDAEAAARAARGSTSSPLTVGPQSVSPELVEGRATGVEDVARAARGSTGSPLTVGGGALRFAIERSADLRAADIVERPNGVDFTIDGVPIQLAVPGRHNVSNALAAIGAALAVGVDLADAARAIGHYKGLVRRLDVVGQANGVTVIDDFGHNPDKITATLQTLHAFPGRLLVYFQPHGYGPLKAMAPELAAAFAANLRDDDRLIVSDPAYFGGTVDRSVGSDALVAMVGTRAEHIADRDACGARLLALARPGDRIVVMGARDDSLSVFAQGLLEKLRSP